MGIPYQALGCPTLIATGQKAETAHSLIDMKVQSLRAFGTQDGTQERTVMPRTIINQDFTSQS